MKILIIDDSSTMRRIIKNTLQRIGYNDFLEAADGSEGLAAVEGADIALEEIKDLDEKEVFEIISLLYAGVKKVEQA